MINKLKESAVKQFLNYGNQEICFFQHKKWTGNELAKEINEETEIGIQQLNMLISLTIDLLNRGKIKTDETK